VIAEEVLEELHRRGVQVEARGECCMSRHPAARSRRIWCGQMRELKPELLRLVALAARTVGEALGGVSEACPSLHVSGICAMRLEDFARAGLVVEVRSQVLEEVLVFASDNARVDPGERRTVYRAHELRVRSDSRLLASCGGFTRSRGRYAARLPIPRA
jgi:hypothetical protein